MNTLNEVEPNLFLGGIGAAKNTDLLKNLNIKAILTVDIQPLPAKFTNDFYYKYIYAQDSVNQNLLIYFDECIDFIDKNLKGLNKVLIHCFQGVSRSSTLLIAYLMKIKNISVLESMNIVALKRCISPNSGFIRQLEIFESLNYKLDIKDPLFKAFRLNQFAKNMLEAFEHFDKDDIPQNLFGIDPLFEDVDIKSEKTYKCKQCRRDLFYESSFLTHSQDYGYLTFEHKHMFPEKDIIKEELDICKDFIFIEPVAWMREQISSIISGKIYCPKCHSKLGSFNWAGERCGCQAWITPAFNIQKSKVDIS